MSFLSIWILTAPSSCRGCLVVLCPECGDLGSSKGCYAQWASWRFPQWLLTRCCPHQFFGRYNWPPFCRSRDWQSAGIEKSGLRSTKLCLTHSPALSGFYANADFGSLSEIANRPSPFSAYFRTGSSPTNGLRNGHWKLDGQTGCPKKFCLFPKEPSIASKNLHSPRKV